MEEDRGVDGAVLKAGCLWGCALNLLFGLFGVGLIFLFAARFGRAAMLAPGGPMPPILLLFYLAQAVTLMIIGNVLIRTAWNRRAEPLPNILIVGALLMLLGLPELLGPSQVALLKPFLQLRLIAGWILWAATIPLLILGGRLAEQSEDQREAGL